MRDKGSGSQAAKALPCHPCREEFTLKGMRRGQSLQGPVFKSSVTDWDMRANV